MESLNIVDGIVIVLVLISAILAYARGLTREIMAIMGWVFSSIISFVFAPLTTPLIKEIPLLGYSLIIPILYIRQSKSSNSWQRLSENKSMTDCSQF